MRALLSVYDKTGLLELARGLADLGVELVSTGGTASALRGAGLGVVEVEALTGWPEMLSGRVKTLHPALHAGILADLDLPAHRADLAAHGLAPFDLVVVNLYPFQREPSIEMIDVGGPTMVRAAAKNHAHVAVVVDPADYPAVLAELREGGGISAATRLALARAAFVHTAAYDAAIARYFGELVEGSRPAEGSQAGGGRREIAGTESTDGPGALPDRLGLDLERRGPLRYGENPHQRAARYGWAAESGIWDAVRQHAGPPPSYLNLFDADAAWRLVHEVGDLPAAVVVKHANPTGLARRADPPEAVREAIEADPVSAFGGILAVNVPLDEATARAAAAGPQLDVVVAPAFDRPAVEILVSRRRNTRLLEVDPPSGRRLDLRAVDGGFLVQEVDAPLDGREGWQVVTRRSPTPSEWDDLELAWVACARSTSNAIVLAAGGVVVGVGAGQQNRVDAAGIAVRKAGERARGAAAASDAFFPFRDGLEALADGGVTAVVQPGGSVRDAEVVAAADARGLAMVTTGRRHFRH